MAPAGEGAASDAPRPLIAAPLAQTPLAHADIRQAEADQVDAGQVEQIRRRFDGLTEGLLDGLLPALPQGPQRDAR